MRSFLLPLCTADEVRDEIGEIDAELDRAGSARIVDRYQWGVARERKFERRRRLVEQLDEMEAA